MAESKLNILLNFTKTGKGGKEAEKELKAVEKAQKRAAETAEILGKATTGAAVGITAFLGAIKGAQAIVAFDARVERAQTALIAFAGGASEAAAALEAVKLAGGGALDTFTASQNAARLFSMGLASSAEEAGRLTEIAITLGAAMGTGPQQAFEDFTLLLANQSILRLDTFGISSSKVKVRMEELTSSVEGMDRETAFMTATLEDAERKLAQLDATGFEAVSSADKLTASIEDMKIALADIAAGPLSDFIEGEVEAISTDAALIKEFGLGATILLTIFGQRNQLIEEYNARLRQSRTETMRWNAVTQHYVDTAEEGAVATDEFGNAIGETTEDTEEAETSIEGLGQTVNGFTRTLEGFVRKSAAFEFDFFKNSDLGVGSAIENALDEMEFLLGGGGELVQLFNQTFEAIKTGAINADVGQALLADLFVEAQALEVELGNIDLAQAAATISEQLNIPIAEALALVNAVINGLDLIDGKTVNAAINVSTNFTAAQGGSGTAASAAAAISVATGGGVTTGGGGGGGPFTLPDIVAPTGGTTGSTGSGTIFGAAGVNMTVPSGNDNDSFLFAAETGENVQITPSGETPGGNAGRGGGGGVHIENINLSDPVMLEMLLTEIGMQ